MLKMPPNCRRVSVEEFLAEVPAHMRVGNTIVMVMDTKETLAKKSGNAVVRDMKPEE
jgi:hypothetical protein